jgi:two-component system, chemotaxis family, sensor kinase CheA
VSGTVDLAEFLSAYLVEMDDHLRAANTSLMAAETSLRKGQPDARSVRDLFRALHTIKGLSAMVGVEPIVTIAHRMENAVRTADRDGGKLPLSSIDALLQGSAAIEQRTRALSDGKTAEPPPEALLAALDAIEAERAPEAPAAPSFPALDPALAGKLTLAEREQIAAGVAAGRRAVRLDFSPSPALAERGIDINGVREHLAAKAEIVRVIPISTPPSAEAPAGLTFVLLILTGAPDTEIAEAVGLEISALRPFLRASADVTPSSPGSDLAVVEPEIEADADAPRRGVLRVDIGRVEEAMERLASLIVIRFRLDDAVAALAASGANTREITSIMGEHARQLRDLRAALLRVRMVPVAEVLNHVPLLVRGLCRATGKLVRLEIDTRGAELDKVVAERIFPALMHLVRNAVDHAIEPPEERRHLGKPEEGLIRIACWARSNTQLELNVADDGRGIDGDFVALRAKREAPRSAAALLDLLCEPGFSTRDRATATSGRGMGLDIVRRITTGELGGELQLSTRPGAGTVFTLRVPLTIAIVDVFVVACAGHRFVVPVAAVEEIVEIDPTHLRRGAFQGADRDGVAVALIDRRGEALPVVLLDAVLRLAGAQVQAEARGQKGIVVRRGGEPLAFAVERMLGQREAVVRPLEDPLVHVRGIAGTTDLGDGRPTVVLDLLALAGGLASGSLGRRLTKGEEWTA